MSPRAMPSIFTANRTALITGASAGIGLELSRALAPKLDLLILVARRLERLEPLAKRLRTRFPALKVAPQATDLSDPESVRGLLQQLEVQRLEVDVLVNNAGLGESELFETSPWSRIQQIIAVNIVAMLRLSHHLLAPMISRGRGAILNIGSGAGYAAMPNAAVYTASKHFVRAFTESLRAQLSTTGITVSEAAPGPVDSEFDEVAGIEGGATRRTTSCPDQRTGMRSRNRAGIRARYTSNISWPELPLVDENAAPHAATTTSNPGRPGSPQNSPERTQTGGLKPSPPT